MRCGTFCRACKTVSCLLAATMLAGGCVHPNVMQDTAQTKTITYNKPAFTPLQGTSERQEKGGVVMTVTPVPYQEVDDPKTEEHEIRRFVNRTYTYGSGAGATDTPWHTVQRTITPNYRVSPDHVMFLVKISNQMDRVFRGAGVVPQFNVGGNVVSTEQSQYLELSGLMIPPRNEASVHVSGPALSSLANGTKIGLFLYDIPIKIDAAGNITQKENFEWYYSYSTQPVTKEGQVKVVRDDQPIGPSVPVYVPPPVQRRR
jgi:hypothetical protein